MGTKKSLLIIVLFILTLTLGGCDSTYNVDQIYFIKAELENVELEKTILDSEIIVLNNAKIITEEIQYIYKDDHIFKPIDFYWYCANDICKTITEDEYNNLVD